MRTLNEMSGHGRCTPDDSVVSQAQSCCLDRIRENIDRFGAPDAESPAEAFSALCGALPGYSEALPQAKATSKRDLVSLPDDDGGRADLAELLRGRDLEAWTSWRRVCFVLRQTPLLNASGYNLSARTRTPY